MADESHVKELLKGVESWNAWRKANPDIRPQLAEIDLTLEAVDGTALMRTDEETKQKIVDLSEIDFHRANMSSAQLHDVELLEANLQGATLRKANFQRAFLLDANLNSAVLYRANLQGADLSQADFRYAHLPEADFRGATLQSANFTEANVTGVKFSRGSLQRNFQGIIVATCYGSQAFKSFAQDQDFIEELRGRNIRRSDFQSYQNFKKYLRENWRGGIKFWLWYIFADCGRSFTRWAAWSLGFATFFGYFYHWMGPHHFHVDRLPFELSSMIYYSVVTFTTLGFGDIKPATIEASFWVMIEVLLGYVMLGGLISILAHKLARRA